MCVSVCLCVFVCAAVWVLCVCADESRVCVSILCLENFSTATNTESLRVHPPPLPLTARTNPDMFGCDVILSCPPSLFFLEVGGCCSCVTLLMPRLCMWEMCQSPPKSCDWLAGYTPPAVQHPLPSLQKPGALRRLGKVSMATATSGVYSLM